MIILSLSLSFSVCPVYHPPPRLEGTPVAGGVDAAPSADSAHHEAPAAPPTDDMGGGDAPDVLPRGGASAAAAGVSCVEAEGGDTAGAGAVAADADADVDDDADAGAEADAAVGSLRASSGGVEQDGEVRQAWAGPRGLRSLMDVLEVCVGLAPLALVPHLGATTGRCF